ncbi:MAG: phosphatidylserine decarboxylase [Nostoc sp. DedQUE04]|uniref:phosphatidylserine decarboxylase n=1 Tax=Nostoc sp. DedQUE04 TaxID=3075390 RepID=UPI002AD3D34C|nr:phosphatidylserine decarboxylase [Nostoc sp. DedQUE04]MDZ8135442.1 phosphatidylserine decarboxylase [Nostoc sp. DedQUE04]
MTSKTLKTEIYYLERQTGEIIYEQIFAEKTLRLLYENYFGFIVFTYLLNNKTFCWLYGKYQDLPLTKSQINKFVCRYQIDIKETELPLKNYHSFNAFFSRRLKPNARIFTTESNIFCAPADSRILVYPKLTAETQIPVKSSSVTIAELLNCEKLAQIYRQGSALCLRLAPYDYHRFHFSDTGKALPAKYIQGKYHSVNPLALAKVCNIFSLNKRMVTEFISDNFGRIAYIEIGAFTIGSIIQTYTHGIVYKGQEKGYFQYGGSTLVLLFQPGTICFDDDLIQHSLEGLEVYVQAGNQIGKKNQIQS